MWKKIQNIFAFGATMLTTLGMQGRTAAAVAAEAKHFEVVAAIQDKAKP